MKRKLILRCLLTLVLSSALFLIKVQFDNKYMRQDPIGQSGILSLDSIDEHPLIFLTYGWEFYQNQLLTPTMLAERAEGPSSIVFLGQYGGFQLGDPERPPFGCATYRLTIQVDGPPRRYALELPQIYGNYRLWVNGQLERDTRIGPSAHSLISFTTQGAIELVIAVESSEGIYSGMVYPPAFGTSDALWRLTVLRLCLASAWCALALLSAVVFLIVGLKFNVYKSALAYSCLCFCYLVCISRVVRSVLGLYGPHMDMLQRLGYFGLFCSVLFVLGQICDMPVTWKVLSGVIAGGICIWLVLFPMLGMDGSTWSRLFFSACVRWYKYGTAALLLSSAGWAVWRRKVHSQAMLAGALVFAVSLIIDRKYPLFEPVLLSWPVETAGLVLVLLTAAILVRANVHVYRDRARLRNQKQAAVLWAEAQERQYRLLAEHLNALRKTKHDLRGLLLYMEELCRQKQCVALRCALEQQLGATQLPERYGSNDLINAILSTFHADAAALGIGFTCQVGNDSFLPLSGLDISRLLTNMLQNAVEACKKVPAGQHRSITFYLRVEQGTLFIRCSNTSPAPAQRLGRHYVSSKRERGHGLGLRFIDEIVSQYGGIWNTSDQNRLFSISISIPAENHANRPAP